MKLCNTHITDLTATIKRKGMGHLMTDSPVLVQSRTIAWLAGKCDKMQFDPRIVSVLEVNAKAQEMLPPIEDGKCPLCGADHFIKNGAGKEWVDNVTDAMHVVALANGLMSRH